MKKLPSITCPGCCGTGKVLDPKHGGEALRAERLKSGIKGTDMATLLGVSPQYLFDMELGNRGWTPERIEKYQAALETAKPKRK